MDALSEVLKVLQFNSAIFFNARFTAPWSIASPEAAAVARQVNAGSERLLFYHFFVEGSCTVKLDDQPPVHPQAGDIILFPQGDAHTMASSELGGAGPLLDVQGLLRRKPEELQLGGGGKPTRIICGYLSCDPILCRPVLAALPRVLTVSLRRDGRIDWLERSFVYAVGEAASTEPGGGGVLAKLSEVLVVETLRRYISQMSEGQTGWFAGLRDRVVGKCLALMHEKPAHPWTLESLAREAGASRSVLAERFSHYVGQSPIQYLGKWRMALASNLLRRTASSIMHIALEVGYETDTAFSRAFRREFGMPPASWRRHHRLEESDRVRRR
jgi:AraC-like DNA-binding protein